LAGDLNDYRSIGRPILSRVAIIALQNFQIGLIWWPARVQPVNGVCRISVLDLEHLSGLQHDKFVARHLRLVERDCQIACRRVDRFVD
jgi:hypothetical protein